MVLPPPYSHTRKKNDMFERFTDRARHSVVVAQELARELHHGTIGTHHMLYGILVSQDEYASPLLIEKGLTPEKIKNAIAPCYEMVDDAQRRTLIFSPNAKKHLELSLREALNVKNNYIGCHHLLLALLRDVDEILGFLDDFGVDASLLYMELRAKIGQPLEEIPEMPIPELPVFILKPPPLICSDEVSAILSRARQIAGDRMIELVHIEQALSGF